MGGKNSGRGGVYTPKIHAEIIKHLKMGAFKKHAANAAGISEACFHDWIERGREGIEPYATFALDVDLAVAEDAVRNQAIISAAAAGPIKGDWKAAAWNLEKKYPLMYGRMAELKLLREREGSNRERPYSPWKQPGDDKPGGGKRLDA